MMDPNIDVNMDTNMDTNIDTNIDPNIDTNIDPNAVQALALLRAGHVLAREDSYDDGPADETHWTGAIYFIDGEALDEDDPRHNYVRALSFSDAVDEITDEEHGWMRRSHYELKPN